MKTAYIILYTLLLFVSCRPLKEKSEYANSEKIQQDIAKQSISMLGQQTDSTQHYWYYTSDSSFYYHPDHGLYGKGGKLWMSEKVYRHALAKEVTDSITYTSWQDRSYTEKTLQRRESKQSIWIIVAMVTILAVLIWFRKSK